MNAESHHVVGTESRSAGRHDVYGPIHKALRLMMMQALARFGSVDPIDEADLRSAVERLDELIAISHLHLVQEERHLHPILESISPGSADTAMREHRKHREDLDALAHDLGALLSADQVDRDRMAAHIYQRLGHLVAESLLHLAFEEETHNPLLWVACDEALLTQIEMRIVADIEPRSLEPILSAMLAALNPAERAALMCSLRSTLPSPQFDAVVDVARRVLDQRAWATLARTIGVPPAPGLFTV